MDISGLIFAALIISSFILLAYALIKYKIVPAYVGTILSVPISLFFSGYEGLHFFPLGLPFLNLIGIIFLKNGKNKIAALYFMPYLTVSFIIILFGLVLDAW
jgi:hypothetical protein